MTPPPKKRAKTGKRCGAKSGVHLCKITYPHRMHRCYDIMGSSYGNIVLCGFTWPNKRKGGK